MTVTTDLANPIGIRRRYFLRIDGIANDFWTPVSEGTTPTDPVTGHVGMSCLHHPVGHGMSLDFSEMCSDLDQMTFEFDDVLGSDGTSYFGKLFSVARWGQNENAHYRISPSNATATSREYVLATDATIPLKSTPAAPANAVTAYVGDETITYEGVDASGLTGVTRGKYPCVIGDSHAARTILRPSYNSTLYQQAVATVPFSIHGRRVALYVATPDSTGAWVTDSDQIKLLWVGRICDTVVFNPLGRTWAISCESILADLKQENIAVNMPSEALGKYSCIYNDETITVKIFRGGICKATKSFTPADDQTDGDAYYTMVRFMFEACAGSITGWDDSGAEKNLFYCEAKEINGKVSIYCWNRVGDTTERTLIIEAPNGSHMLAALGFNVGTTGGTLKIQFTDAEGSVQAENYYATYYHPVHPDRNDGKIYINSKFSNLWTNQGDGCACAYASIDNVITGASNEIGRAVVAYTAITEVFCDTMTGALTLATGSLQPFPIDPRAAIIKRYKPGESQNDKTCPELKQVYIPTQRASNYLRNPFTMLLFPLLSTGTPGYNTSGSYNFDAVPYEISAGIDANIVDIDSFLAADTSGVEFLSDRRHYMIYNPTSIFELLIRECKLFGYALVWANGKITLRKITSPTKDKCTVTLDDSTRARAGERPTLNQSFNNVINRYEIKLRYDAAGDKYLAPLTVTDMDSASCLRVFKTATIEHPGVYTSDTDAQLVDKLTTYFANRFWRFPGNTITVSLAPYLLGRVYAGDTVRFKSSFVPDPCGSGSLTTDCYAIVIRVSWDKLIGSAELYLFPEKGAGLGNPWAPSAVISAGGEAWNSSVRTLVLSRWEYSAYGQPHDGQRFKAGDKITIAERCPSNIYNSQTWGPLTLAADYNNSTCLVEFIEGTDLPEYTNAREYVMTHANYSSCNATSGQLDLGTWGCDYNTELIAPGVKAARWG